jgi:hypothetical protein
MLGVKYGTFFITSKVSTSIPLSKSPVCCSAFVNGCATVSVKLCHYKPYLSLITAPNLLHYQVKVY